MFQCLLYPGAIKNRTSDTPRWRVPHTSASGIFRAVSIVWIGFLCCLGTAARDATPAASYRPPVFSDPARIERVKPLAAEIAKIYSDYARDNHFPGVAWGVVIDGQLVVSDAYGHTDVAKQTPATPQSLFRIASMTKSFTAMAILKLRDQGKLLLDHPAAKYLPELRKVKYLSSDSPPITIRHLLTHGAGFPEDNPWGDRQLADSDRDLEDLIRQGVYFSNTPGTTFEYSNLGFALLGRVVAKVSGESCQRYIERHILRPLGMRDTAWDYTKIPSARLAHGYRWEEAQWKKESLLGDGSYAPMGGLISSVEDFARYMAVHIAAWPARDDADSGPIQRSSLREMHHPWRPSGWIPDNKRSDGTPCPAVNAYGYGLGWTQDCDQRVRIGHSGGLPGFGSQWRFLPEYGIGVVALANRTYAGLTQPNNKVVELLIQSGGLKPRELPVSDMLEQRKEGLLKLLPHWNNAEATGIFAENFFPDHPVALLRRNAAELFRKAGAISGAGPVKPENQLRGTFTLEGTEQFLDVFFTLTPENPPRIQELRLRLRTR